MGDARAKGIDEFRSVTAEEGVLPVLAVTTDDVVAGGIGREQFRDFLRRVLQVGIERHHDLAAYALERRHDRHVLAEIAVEIDDPHFARPLAMKIAQQDTRTCRVSRRW